MPYGNVHQVTHMKKNAININLMDGSREGIARLVQHRFLNCCLSHYKQYLWFKHTEAGF